MARWRGAVGCIFGGLFCSVCERLGAVSVGHSGGVRLCGVRGGGSTLRERRR